MAGDVPIDVVVVTTLRAGCSFLFSVFFYSLGSSFLVTACTIAGPLIAALNNISLVAD